MRDETRKRVPNTLKQTTPSFSHSESVATSPSVRSNISETCVLVLDGITEMYETPHHPITTSLPSPSHPPMGTALRRVDVDNKQV